ncbi:MAG: hypothetical protein E6Q29_14145 [Alicycliphilus sp.]|nr:MAG: hypothetical protein E6Q29_14145 [Alicycliphilus sp.]
MMLLAGICARRRTYLSLLRQRKVGQRKTTLLSVSLRFATGNLRCSCAIRAIAALGPIRHSTPHEAERSDGPCRAVHPLWLRLGRGACGVSMRVEARMLA